MTPVQAQEVITLLLAAFPRDLRDEEVEMTSKIYRLAMRDLDYEQAMTAVAKIVGTAKKLPKIAELREAMLEIGIGGQRSGAEAWGDVRKAVHKFGAYNTPVFADPIVADAVESVGWRAICLAEETDPSPRSKFADAYNGIAARRRKEQLVTPGATGKLPAPRAPAALPPGPALIGDLIKNIKPGAGEP